MAFATVEDLQARWRELTEDEAAKAEVLLEDAATLITALVHDTSHLPEDVLRLVSCNMVSRQMQAQEQADAIGLFSQYSQTAGPYQESYTPVNPTGDMYLTANERKMLGLARAQVFTVMPHVGHCEPAPREGDDD